VNSSENVSLYGSRTAAFPISVIVVGCGIGGLAAAHCLLQAGHRVTIVESASTIGEVGAGLLVPPNCSRLLRRWGLAPLLQEMAVRIEALVFCRYNTGERIGYITYGEKPERNYGSPHYSIHRVDLHKMLFDLVVPKAELRLCSTVVSCDPDSQSPSVTLASGEVLKVDLIVGADGVKSYIQQVVAGEPTKAVPTGDAAYRAIVPASLLLEDNELRELFENQEMTCWVGPGRHLVAYPVVSLIVFHFSVDPEILIRMSYKRGGEGYNLVLAHPDDGSVESWTAEGCVDDMRQEFDEFEPRYVLSTPLMSLIMG
jgi:salicylate hydroxylase